MVDSRLRDVTSDRIHTTLQLSPPNRTGTPPRRQLGLNRRRRLALGVVLSTALGAGMFWLAFRAVDLHEVGAVLREADVGLALLGAVLVFIPAIAGAVRWRLITRDFPAPSLVVMTELVLAGAATTNTFPGRLGEPVRALGLSRVTGRPFMRAIGSVVVDRIADVLFACLCLAATVWAVSSRVWVWWLGIGGAVVATAGVAVIVLASRERRNSDRTRDWRRHLHALATGLDCIRNRRSSAPLIAIVTATGWTSWVVGAWVTARALGIDLTAAGVVFTFAVIALGSAIPSAPGFVGTYHWLASNSLMLFGVSAPRSVAYAVLLHAIWFLPVTVLGLIAMLRLGLGFSTVRQAGLGPAEESAPCGI